MRGRHSQLDQCQSAAGPNSGSGRDRCLQVGNEPGDVVRRHHRGVKVDRDLLAVTVDNQLHGEHDDQKDSWSVAITRRSAVDRSSLG